MRKAIIIENIDLWTTFQKNDFSAISFLFSCFNYLVGNLLQPVQCPDVIQGVDAGTESAVEAEDLSVDQGGQGKVVEKVREVLPHVGVSVLAEALVVEAVDLRDLTGLVVAAQDRDALTETNLEV